ncbi:uncharacterized protein LOC111895177 [Lactuca sativa]|uniref:DUF4378 domain-containing protein n=1 Tax=Lactuca sativa TaxID=4236 RepID=A0A9R1XAS3_LACSA|nr:uncharacterized protein LOC111895177 [Lactuca sativa]XP_023747047.1 uncharacterized protein LOC111895177 [Lactuca sativa]KAJ0201707.1 hypothetical protein LSAT_V11C600306140 [Lactuca sativa]
MGVQKHGSKGGGSGGYVGGFLHLFDWNAKSRKKLFSSKSESPEQPKQTKRTDGNMPMTRFNMMEEDEMIGGLSYKESSDYSCATSITDDDNYGTKAPGVVARLMGLDSLPTFNFSDTYSNPSFDSQSYKDSSTPYITKDPKFESIDCQMEAIKSTPQKRAFEKFQTEALPPKSAKSIPITRHKLLSPIKNSKFVSSSNPKSIMEAATKIPFGGSSSSSPSPSSSVPFRVKVSKENLSRKPKVPEGSRRGIESNGVKNVKGQQSLEPKKSISLALQAKANVQKREGLNHRTQSVKTQSNTERNTQKNPVSLNVLKQNNQKQNSLVDRGKSTPQTRKQISSQKSSSKVSENIKTSHKKEPYSTTRRKRSMEDNNHGEKNVVRDKSYRSSRNDVVSFTFTSPISRPIIPTNNASNSSSSSLNYNVIGSDALSTLLEQKLRELTGTPASVSQDSLMEGDIRDDSSHGFSSYDPLHLTRKNKDQDMIDKDDSSVGFSSYDPLQLMKNHQDQDMITRDDSSCGFSSYDPLKLMKKHQGQDRIKCDLSYGFSSNNNPQELMKHNKVVEPMSECSTNDYEYRKFLRAQQPSPNSVLEPSFITESCNSSDTADSCKPNSTSVQGQELIGKANTFSRNSTPMDVDTELLDSASSTSKLTKWEPDYVTQVLEDIETMFTDFTLGKTRKIVNPRVFDKLEFGKPNEEVVKLRRELVFNCVSECMETRSRVWGKGLAMVSRPNRLAQDVYKEIVGWEDMKDSMVDELVDKDMSGEGYKRWLDFDVEVFEYGVEIESWLIDSLINEVVDDILVL